METLSKPKVIVIGAGLGGVSAAIALAAAGFEVEIYEKNAHVGGKLNVLQKEGFSFDLGPSILTLPHIFQRLFALHGRKMEDYVSIQHLFPHWRNFFEDGTVVDLYPDLQEMKNKNTLLSERDMADLERFLAYSAGIYAKVERGYFDKGLDTPASMVKFYGLLSSLKDFGLFSTMDKTVRRYIKNPYLADILNFFSKYVGSSPYDAPAVLNLLPHAQFQFGLWYVKGGMYNLARGLEKLMREVGVKVYLNTEVVRLCSENQKVNAVLLKDGTRKTGEIFVSNMEVIPAYKDLLGEEVTVLAKLEKFEPACSGLVLHLGLDRPFTQLAHHNFFYSRDPKTHYDTVFHRKQLPADPTIYLVAPAKTDPSQAPPACENLKILPHIPYLQDTPFSQEDYRQLRENVLVKLERMGLQDLRKHIILEDMWLPEDIHRWYYSNRGAIYGVVSDRKKNLGFKAPKQSRRYKNLYFVGGSVNPGGGMPMVVLSGQQVKDMIVDRYGCQT